jgi:hypothetical protein
MLVAAGFMPAFKYRQKNSLMVVERGASLVLGRWLACHVSGNFEAI